MFEKHQIERDYADIDISDEAFDSLFRFFDKWNWHLDTRLTSSGRDINPDVLGYIFEQYINDRAQMGAYYTKEDITEYIGRNCILPFLFDATRRAADDEGGYFAPDGFVWSTLRSSGSRYIFDAVKKGYDLFDKIPQSVLQGIITPAMRHEYAELPVSELPEGHVPLAELRSEWNTRTPEPWGLPSEIWRETIERLQRCADVLHKIESGEITSINDFITYNLDIRSFAQDLLSKADSRFLARFYAALQRVTILDPTCGSGAFLFAAMNILEPLYEICIDRMQEFNAQNPRLFTAELAEITHRYRSNIQYFIFKSIILRNLYGVDIMVEATEIAKLRLFLKMVAVVDVDLSADNMGLDPLPDIDFNIRCGNTLVGYANMSELDRDLEDCHGSMWEQLANEDFKDKILEEVHKVALTYETFKKLQLTQEENMAAFKQAKVELSKRLDALNDQLNHRLFAAYASDSNLSYEGWLKSHQPFNWFADFYQIIHENGGFDVIVGNPPYVEYSRKKVKYVVNYYQTLSASNLYAFILERSFIIGRGINGLIIQLSALGTVSMKALRQFVLEKSTFTFYGAYPERPHQLFDGACIALSIFICKMYGKVNKRIFSSGINRVSSSFRECLFRTIVSVEIDKSDMFGDFGLFPKFKFQIEKEIFKKVNSNGDISFYLGTNPNNIISYRSAGGRYWKIILNRRFFGDSSSIKTKTLGYLLDSCEVISVLNANLFWVYYANYFDLYNLGDYMLFSFPYTSDEEVVSKKLRRLGDKLMKSFEKNKSESTQFITSKNKVTVFETFNPALSKPIIDEIDRELAKHYGFTEEELDFIINYDIKYRMGDELNADD